jgi:hypothetical protein
MGMCLVLTMLGDEHLTRIQNDPPLVWLAVAPDEPGMYDEARAPARPSLLDRLLGRTPTSPARERLTLTAPDGEQADLDKAWHALHYLLTGSAWDGAPPEGFLLTGGTELAAIEVGYGSPRLLTAAETRAVDAALTQVTEADLLRRWDPPAMMQLEIYPEIWDRDGTDDDPRGYVLEYFGALKKFVARAAASGRGLVITLT